MALSVVVACGSPTEDEQPPAARPPSAVLISIDTLRADHLGAYGYARARTPVLDGLAASGVLYERAYSPSSWTLPSHKSMLTGRYPARREAAPSIAQRLRDGGWATAAFTGGGIMSEDWGFADGFDTFYAYQRSSSEGCTPDRFGGQEVFGRAVDWLADRPEEPFFLFVHTYEAHDRCEFLPSDLLTTIPDPGPEERLRLVEYYDGLISRADGLVGDLLAALDDLGASDSTVVIVTSDHGESLWEHGEFGHNCNLKPYESLVHVPLLVRWPDRIRSPRRIADPVSVVDIVPTLLAVAGLPLQPWVVADVLPGLGMFGAETPPVFTQCGDRVAVWEGRFKLITSSKDWFPDELYDLGRDPDERQNLALVETAVARRMRRLAEAYWKPASAHPDGATAGDIPDFENVDGKVRERLRALGYLPRDE